MANDGAQEAAACKPEKDALKAASAAHEVKNFAESLTNLVYLLQQNPTLDQDARKYVQLIEDQLEDMRYVLTQTLARYRELDAPTQTSVGDILEIVLRFSERRITSKGVQVEKRFECDGIVNAQAEDLRQVFSNLVMNALQALPPTGKLSVHMRQSRNWADAEALGVRVLIADNGVGIPAQHRSKIFRQAITTKRTNGSGLGLLITSRMVQDYGGTLRFRSSTKPGRSGTVFSLFLPAAVTEYKPAGLPAANIATTSNMLRQPDEPHMLPAKENRAIAERLIAENKRLLEQIQVHFQRYATLKALTATDAKANR